MKLVQFHENWAYHVDSLNNHMVYELKEVKNKNTQEVTKQWRHTGSFFNNHKDMFSHIFKILRNREFEGEGIVQIEEFMLRLDKVLENLSEIYEAHEEVIKGGK